MKVDKLSISIDADMAEDLRQAATHSGRPVSAWVAEAIARQLRRKALEEFMAEWEAEQGAFTEEERAQAAIDLGLPIRKKRKAS